MVFCIFQIFVILSPDQCVGAKLAEGECASGADLARMGAIRAFARDSSVALRLPQNDNFLIMHRAHHNTISPISLSTLCKKRNPLDTFSSRVYYIHFPMPRAVARERNCRSKTP